MPTDRPRVATFLMLGRIEIVELLATAGFDAVVIDLEHGAVEQADLPGLAAAAAAAGVAAWVRLPDRDPALVARALDAGVDGIIAPHVDSARDAHELVAAARFPPEGRRSLNPYVRGLGYGARATAAPRVLAMIESAAGLAEAEPILQTAGLDGVFVGPMDLAGSLGVPGQPTHPLVRDAVESVLAAAVRHQRVGATYAPDPTTARRDLTAGAGLVALSADLRMVAEGFARVRDAVGDAAEPGV